MDLDSRNIVFRLLFSVILLFTAVFHIFGGETPVIINEILAANSEGIRSEDGDPSDWIEQYNVSESPANLKNFPMTDERRNKENYEAKGRECGTKEVLNDAIKVVTRKADNW